MVSASVAPSRYSMTMYGRPSGRRARSMMLMICSWRMMLTARASAKKRSTRSGLAASSADRTFTATRAPVEGCTALSTARRRAQLQDAAVHGEERPARHVERVRRHLVELEDRLAADVVVAEDRQPLVAAARGQARGDLGADALLHLGPRDELVHIGAAAD